MKVTEALSRSVKKIIDKKEREKIIKSIKKIHKTDDIDEVLHMIDDLRPKIVKHEKLIQALKKYENYRIEKSEEEIKTAAKTQGMTRSDSPPLSADSSGDYDSGDSGDDCTGEENCPCDYHRKIRSRK